VFPHPLSILPDELDPHLRLSRQTDFTTVEPYSFPNRTFDPVQMDRTAEKSVHLGNKRIYALGFQRVIPIAGSSSDPKENLRAWVIGIALYDPHRIHPITVPSILLPLAFTVLIPLAESVTLREISRVAQQSRLHRQPPQTKIH
jgi:hypothetical protein